MSCGIYLIKHRGSGKSYVGQSIDVERRWKEHESGLSKCPALSAAVAKYGWAQFSCELLENCEPGSLNEREAFWIAELRTVAPLGYNLNTGGGQGRSLSEESRALMSKAAKSPERLKTLRELHKDLNCLEKKSRSAATSKKAKAQRKAMYSDLEVQERRRQAIINSPKAKAQRERLHARFRDGQ